MSKHDSWKKTNKLTFEGADLTLDMRNSTRIRLLTVVDLAMNMKLNGCLSLHLMDESGSYPVLTQWQPG